MSATSLLDHLDPPAPGAWQLDASHSEVAFVGRHLGITKTRGRFTKVEGSADIHEDVTRSRFDILIDMTSVDSGFGPRDDSLRSDRFFDVHNYPTATFRTTSISLDGPIAHLTGDLTIKRTTRPVVFALEFHGVVDDPWGSVRAAFSATATIDRTDWEVGAELGDSGPTLISRDIALCVEAELVRV